jgi:hypothetical protein
VAGTHEEEDSIQQTKEEPGRRSKQAQQEALDRWERWVLDSDDGLTRGLQAPLSSREY